MTLKGRLCFRGTFALNNAGRGLRGLVRYGASAHVNGGLVAYEG